MQNWFVQCRQQSLYVRALAPRSHAVLSMHTVQTEGAHLAAQWTFV